MKILENYKNLIVNETVDVSQRSNTQNSNTTHTEVISETMGTITQNFVDSQTSSNNPSQNSVDLQNSSINQSQSSAVLQNSSISQSQTTRDVTQLSNHQREASPEVGETSTDVKKQRTINENVTNDSVSSELPVPDNSIQNGALNAGTSFRLKSSTEINQNSYKQVHSHEIETTESRLRQNSSDSSVNHVNVSLDLLNCSGTESFSLSHPVVCPTVGLTPGESNDVPFTSTQLARVSPQGCNDGIQTLDISSVLDDKQAVTPVSKNHVAGVIKNRNERTHKHLNSKTNEALDENIDFIDEIDVELKSKGKLIYVKDKGETNIKNFKGKKLVAKLKSKMGNKEPEGKTDDLEETDTQEKYLKNGHKKEAHSNTTIKEKVHEMKEKIPSSTISKLKQFAFDKANSSIARRQEQSCDETNRSVDDVSLNQDQKSERKVSGEDSGLSESMMSGHLWTDSIQSQNVTMTNAGSKSQMRDRIDSSARIKRACDLLNLVRNTTYSHSKESTPSSSQSPNLAVSFQSSNNSSSEIVPQCSQSPSWLTTLNSRKLSTPVFSVTNDNDDLDDLDLELDVRSNPSKRQKVS